MALDRDSVISTASEFLSGKDLAASLGVSPGLISQIRRDVREEAAENQRNVVAAPGAESEVDESIDSFYDRIELAAAKGVFAKMETMVALGKPMELLKVAAVANGLRRRTGVLKGNGAAPGAPGGPTFVSIQVGTVLQPKLTLSAQNEIIAVDGRPYTTAANDQVLRLAAASEEKAGETLRARVMASTSNQELLPAPVTFDAGPELNDTEQELLAMALSPKRIG